MCISSGSLPSSATNLWTKADSWFSLTLSVSLCLCLFLCMSLCICLSVYISFYTPFSLLPYFVISGFPGKPKNLEVVETATLITKPFGKKPTSSELSMTYSLVFLSRSPFLGCRLYDPGYDFLLAPYERATWNLGTSLSREDQKLPCAISLKSEAY